MPAPEDCEPSSASSAATTSIRTDVVGADPDAGTDPAAPAEAEAEAEARGVNKLRAVTDGLARAARRAKKSGPPRVDAGGCGVATSHGERAEWEWVAAAVVSAPCSCSRFWSCSGVCRGLDSCAPGAVGTNTLLVEPGTCRAEEFSAVAGVPTRLRFKAGTSRRRPVAMVVVGGGAEPTNVVRGGESSAASSVAAGGTGLR